MNASNASSARAPSGRSETGIFFRGAAFVTAHPVRFIFLLALGVRLFIAVVLTSYFSGTLVLDDTTYHTLAQMMAEGDTSGWDDFINQLYWSTGAFTVPITFLYKIFGPSPIVGQLFVTVMGTFTAVFVYLLAREFLSLRWALVAGGIVALLPSQAFWSSMLMKDASVWFALGGLGATVAVASRATGKHLALLGVAAGSLLVMLSYLRLHTLVVAVWALMIAAFFGVKADRMARVAGALILGITIPWVFGGIGPVGLSLIADHGSLEERRFFNAQGANTAVVPAVVPTPVDPQVDNRPVLEVEAQAVALEDRAQRLESRAVEIEPKRPAVAEQFRTEANELRSKAEVLHEKVRVAVASEPETVPPLGSEGSDEAALNPNLAHLPRGLSVMLLEPFPVPFAGTISLKLARLEALLWYPLLILAAVGLWNLRSFLRQMVFPLLVGGGIVVMYALSEGNIGTAHRHRGEFVWVVALLAASGLAYLRRDRSPDP